MEDGGWSFLDQEGGSDAEGEDDESEGDGARALPCGDVFNLVDVKAMADCLQPAQHGCYVF